MKRRIIEIEGDYLDVIVDPTAPPERHLVASVVMRAICDATAVSRWETPAHITREARAWLGLGRIVRLTSEQEWSFEWCCSLLSLCPRELRRVVRCHIKRNTTIAWK